jgi:hypothetical protein
VHECRLVHANNVQFQLGLVNGPRTNIKFPLRLLDVRYAHRAARTAAVELALHDPFSIDAAQAHGV